MNLKERFEANRAKYEAMGNAAVGNDLRVTLTKSGGKSTHFGGEIISATPLNYRVRGRSAVVRFEVALRHRTTGTVRKVIVEKLPR